MCGNFHRARRHQGGSDTRVKFPAIKDQRDQKPRSGEPLADTTGVKNKMCPHLCDRGDPKNP